jgi:4-hydroxybenzoate polyprenyltransferase
MSVGYQTAAILLAGFTPAIAAWLVQITGGTWPLVLVIVVTTLIAAAAVLTARETKDFDLDRIGEAPNIP